MAVSPGLHLTVYPCLVPKLRMHEAVTLLLTIAVTSENNIKFTSVKLTVLHWHIIWPDGQNAFYSLTVTSFEG